MPRPQYLPALTGFRFVLAMWVILHHLIGPGMMLEQWVRTIPDPARRLLEGGYLAVQTFFILSGFVLARTYASATWNRRDLARFALARFARVYPVYALSLLVMSPFIAETLTRPGRSEIQKAALLGQYIFLLIGWLTPRGVGWNTPAWSLTCEFFFYLCFPALFLWLRKGTMPRLLSALALSFVLPIALAHAGVPAVWKPIHHLSDFVAGIVAAKLFERIENPRHGYWLYLPAVAAGFALITHPQVLTGTLADLNTALRPLNVALLIGLALNGGGIALVLSSRAADYLGQASYSMYILHVPLLWWYSRYAFHKLGSPPHTGAALAFLALVVAASIAAFELVEKPANRRLRGGQATAPQKTSAPLRPRFDTPEVSYSHASVPAASESVYSRP